MSQEQCHTLLVHIRNYYQQQHSLDTFFLERKKRWLLDRADDYNNWSIPGQDAFIASSKGCPGSTPVFAFSPATEEQIVETEQQLGFLLPPLLRQLYLQIANGGFGPGYGIIGAIGGFPLLNGFGDDLVKGYRQMMRHCRLVHLQEYEMITWTQWMQEPEPSPFGDQEESGVPSASRNQPHPDREHLSLYALPEEVWPEHMLPLCYWGHGICTSIDADTEHIFQYRGGEYGYILRPVASSLEEWLERWLAGESLQIL